MVSGAAPGAVRDAAGLADWPLPSTAACVALGPADTADTAGASGTVGVAGAVSAAGAAGVTSASGAMGVAPSRPRPVSGCEMRPTRPHWPE